MPNDAKLGLVIGLGLVMVVAVIFFRRDLTTGPAAAGLPANPPAAAKVVPDDRPVRAKRSSQTGEVAGTGPTLRRHTVREGETLFDLAKQYYGDAERCTDLLKANREVLDRPDELKPGTVLIIPDPGMEKAAVDEKP
jgi:nucleoid-associated protein YgaU